VRPPGSAAATPGSPPRSRRAGRAVSAVKLRFETRLLAHRDDAAWTAREAQRAADHGAALQVSRAARVRLGWSCGRRDALAIALACRRRTCQRSRRGRRSLVHAVGDWLERQLFFRAQATPAMPGA
jgi:hypothetical protein